MPISLDATLTARKRPVDGEQSQQQLAECRRLETALLCTAASIVNPDTIYPACYGDENAVLDTAHWLFGK
jgi:hypothetical protein